MNNVYIYDSGLGERRYQKLLAQLETRLTDLGLSGKIYRLSPMTRLNEIVRDEIKRRPKTIVAVGGDALVSRVASLLSASTIPLGIIPVGEQGACAESLGITMENACRTLSARRIVALDVGRLDAGRMFLCQASLTVENAAVRLDRDIEITIDGPAEIKVVNILSSADIDGVAADPEDGRFNVYINTKASSFLKKEVSHSLFMCKSLELQAGVKRVVLDNAAELDKADRIDIVPHAILVIVGKERKF